MTIQQLLITGLRGFAETQKVEFATPNGEPGSGMTVLVGPNGGGKSTVLEALRAAALQSAASFSLGQRNHEAGDAVEICWISEAGTGVLRSVRRGSSETVREGDAPRLERLVHLPSRRSFNPYFGESIVPREVYAGGYQIPNFRAQPVDLFAAVSSRLNAQGQDPSSTGSCRTSLAHPWIGRSTDKTLATTSLRSARVLGLIQAMVLGKVR